MNKLRPSGHVTVAMAAPATAVWQLISDVTRMGEWSPECYRCEWLAPAAGPAVGARFRGYNRLGVIRWSRICEITAAEPGRSFAFYTIPGSVISRDSILWRYDIASTGKNRCEVTESYEVLQQPPPQLLRLIGAIAPHHLDPRPQMQTTLQRLKATAETGLAEVRESMSQHDGSEQRQGG